MGLQHYILFVYKVGNIPYFRIKHKIWTKLATIRIATIPIGSIKFIGTHKGLKSNTKYTVALMRRWIRYFRNLRGTTEGELVMVAKIQTRKLIVNLSEELKKRDFVLGEMNNRIKRSEQMIETINSRIKKLS